MFLGLIFPNQAVPVNFSELIRRLRSLRLGLLNLLRKVKILELRTQRQITEASATGSIWLRLAPFGSVWLRGGFHFSDLYGGFYSSFLGSHPRRLALAAAANKKPHRAKIESTCANSANCWF